MTTPIRWMDQAPKYTGSSSPPAMRFGSRRTRRALLSQRMTTSALFRVIKGVVGHVGSPRCAGPYVIVSFAADFSRNPQRLVVRASERRSPFGMTNETGSGATLGHFFWDVRLGREWAPH